MTRIREDSEYLRKRVSELYGNHTAKQVSQILNNDPEIAAPVTEHIVFNVMKEIRSTFRPTYNDRPWAEDDDNFLQQWRAHGATVQMIAEQLLRHRTSVLARIGELGLLRRRLTTKQTEVVLCMLRMTTKTAVEIAEELGVSYHSVLRLRKEVNLKTVRSGEIHTNEGGHPLVENHNW